MEQKIVNTQRELDVIHRDFAGEVVIKGGTPEKPLCINVILSKAKLTYDGGFTMLNLWRAYGDLLPACMSFKPKQKQISLISEGEIKVGDQFLIPVSPSDVFNYILTVKEIKEQRKARGVWKEREVPNFYLLDVNLNATPVT